MHSDRVLAEEVDLVYRMIPTSILGQIPYVLAMGGIHWKHTARTNGRASKAGGSG